MKEIALTQDQIALVDDDDFDWLSRWKWYAAWDKTTRTFYAVRNGERVNGHRRPIKMHREILGLGFADHRQCDHKDKNSLNNQRINLRVASPSQNSLNRRFRTTTGVRGVVKRKNNKWVARITVNKKRICLGTFDTCDAASQAYEKASIEFHGEFGVCL